MTGTDDTVQPEDTAQLDPNASVTPQDESPGARRVRRARIVQIALGCVWIVDAALQFQPRMFGHEFITEMILPNAQGQPAPVAWSITQMGHFLNPDVAVWNFLFGMIQLLIGVGMFFRRTLKPAIVAMAVWAFGVWWFGEGFGGLLHDSASPLMGAPGAVVLYPLIGLLVWPSGESSEEEPGIASSAGASGPLGANAAMFAWSGFWVLSAALWLFPSNRSAGAVSSMVTGMAGGEPSWYGHFLTSVGNALPQSGSGLAWLMAAVSLVIGLGPLCSRRPLPFLVAGAALETLFWITGMAMGGILTGMGTDPNAGPLVILLAFALVPTLHAVPEHAPVRAFARRHPVAGVVTSGAAMAVLLVSATYPVASAAESASAPASNTSAWSSSPTQTAMAGMAMGSSSGTGGKGEPTWHYTGPALPAQERSVLTSVFDATEKGHAMQTPNCDKSPTGSQVETAMQLVQTTSSAVAKYKDLAVAKADGYFPITNPSYPVVHYVNPAYMQDKDVLDPGHVQSLVYATTPNGPVLAAAMYLMPSASEQGPMPGGCLTQWHKHTNLCIGGPTGTISGFSQNGACAADERLLRTPEMLHVWQVPVPGGPLAMDPTDQQVVESAIMAQPAGQVPASSGA